MLKFLANSWRQPPNATDQTPVVVTNDLFLSHNQARMNPDCNASDVLPFYCVRLFKNVAVSAGYMFNNVLGEQQQSCRMCGHMWRRSLSSCEFIFNLFSFFKRTHH